jgi:uncharacterized membrane protein YfcA
LQHFEPQVFQSVWIALAVLVIVFAGSVVQAGLGMGFGLTAAPVLALIDPVLVPVSALYVGTATSMAGAIKEHPNIVWREVGIGLTGRFIGLLLGLYLLIWMTSPSTFYLVFGSIILVAVMLSVAGWRLALTKRNLLAMGFFSGFSGIITSVGAPPLALIYQHQPAVRTRATLASFFAIGGMVSLIVLHLSGLANFDHLLLALFMAPAALLGTWVARRMLSRFDSRYRVFLLAVAAVASVLLIARGLA